MRSIGIALTAALVALTAGTVSAQQNQITLQMGSASGVVAGSGGTGTAVVVTDGSEAVASTNSLEGIALTGKQRDAVAKLDSARAQAIEAANAQHTAAVRALLTDAQRAKFDQNEATRKEQLELARKSLNDAKGAQTNAQSTLGNMIFQIQSGGGMSVTPSNK